MGRAQARRWIGLGALSLCMLALGFDMTILNVALTTLSEDLHASTGELQWIVDSYLLVFAAVLLPAGLLGDRLGRKRLLLLGLGVFGAASLAGAFADGTGGVIAARAFMGLGGAIVLPLSMSMLPAIFPPEERTRAVAVWSAANALGLPLGPLLGGWLLQNFWWGSIFLVNVPVVVAGGIAVALLLPETRDPAAPRVDLAGSLLSMGGLVALVYGVIEAPVRGWGDAVVLGSFALAAVLLTGFVLSERRTAEPMLNLRLFRDRAFGWAVVAAVAANLLLGGLLFVLPQYLEAVLPRPRRHRAPARGRGRRGPRLDRRRRRRRRPAGRRRAARLRAGRLRPGHGRRVRRLRGGRPRRGRPAVALHAAPRAGGCGARRRCPRIDA